MTSIECLWDCPNCDTEIQVKIDINSICPKCNLEYEWDFDCDYDDAVYIPIFKQPKMTPVQTLYRWFNDNPEATYKEALEAYEHCLELEQQLPQPMRFHCVPKEISDEEILDAAAKCRFNDLDISVGSFELGARWYREQLKQKK